MWVYNVQLFYPLPGHSHEESKLALWIVAVTLDVIGVIATFNCRRNDVSTLSNTVLPFELYTLITFYLFSRGSFKLIVNPSDPSRCVFCEGINAEGKQPYRSQSLLI